ncbi:hypothetical protein N7520_011448 [Penicillium odoratum]|uniref:uncharacterized protein n=1 Tax=Penicillium odoratum TaxID=1167516 RepID=UPI00254883CD|nr:uncharacterized protein N7520_011448 [Penicillium odoratum]KAJ5746266.1 hypothetical protein N7520_011448 [Penicillium odoratum]
MFGVQFDTAGIYLVGTPTEQFHLSFEEMMAFEAGIIGLLEYGVTWKVLKGIISRIRYRLWNRAGTSMETPALWIDNSGPIIYEIRHGMESIRITPQDLENSRLGRVIKEHWDMGMTEPSTRFATRMLFEAFFIGLWRNILRRLKIKNF